MNLKEQIEELVSQTCNVGSGTQVTNCLLHMNKPLTERPTECKLCSADVQNHLRKAVGINAWLNTWKDNAEHLLREVTKEDLLRI